MSETRELPERLPRPFVFCGEDEPTFECSRRGWCDYHGGRLEAGVDPELAQREADAVRCPACGSTRGRNCEFCADVFRG